VREAGKVVGRE